MLLPVIVAFASVFGLIEHLSTRRPKGEEYKTLAEQLQSEARREFEKIRGVVVREVNLEVVNQSWVAENWGTSIDSERETIVREKNGYKALFLISQGVSLY